MRIGNLSAVNICTFGVVVFHCEYEMKNVYYLVVCFLVMIFASTSVDGFFHWVTGSGNRAPQNDATSLSEVSVVLVG